MYHTIGVATASQEINMLNEKAIKEFIEIKESIESEIDDAVYHIEDSQETLDSAYESINALAKYVDDMDRLIFQLNKKEGKK